MKEAEEPVVCEIKDKTHTRRLRMQVSEIGATKNFHADCPCCGLRFQVAMSESEQSMLRRTEITLQRKTRDRVQHYLTDVWKWKTIDRAMHHSSIRHQRGMKHISKGVRSPSGVRCIVTGVGKALRMNWHKANECGWDDRKWFAVLLHDAPVLGEMFVAFKLGSLFSTLQAIADDSPEFAYRLRQAADNALKRDGSALRDRDDPELPGGRGEGGGELFNGNDAVRV